MLRIGWILTILLGLGWLASEIPLQSASSNDQPKVQTCWRRTVEGWENSDQWYFFAIAREPILHPFYLCIMQCAAIAGIAVSCYLAKSIFSPNLNRAPNNDEKAPTSKSIFNRT